MEKNLKQTQNNSNLIKVVLFGPESTGKTTLAQALAKHYKTHWVPEYMREFLQQKWNLKKQKCTKEDLLPIALGQMNLENELANDANKLLFCDTDLLELKVYSEVYYEGFCPPEIEKAAVQNQYDFYFLMYIDTIWEEDDLRDKPGERDALFYVFEKALKKAKRPYTILKGNKENRIKEAIQLVDDLVKNEKIH
ncbi:MAG: nicotinate-nucleotide adenylyltransferase [Flavobacteriaceae bacterium CG_4_8_14_3_um_filter_34_10]|nr:ATP-binding protein [Flavobacteriia bacterium]OIP51275.1 MAG: nicotinate-nucleotide adenylyltransferase [Flavobacteriaceae bacterium CG2_30_34_30]PIQ18681.1 MAG: nicotinate-nucleotide adenylyltransferase [Flavobacteriaceae bacterium CG18_big_fil_WC_8_21_14_2_50_34_36]PIV48769.1 MAG: nicotinate-nucleotide adenylyltransferase [Flavobacteriaceae bacterium CG02_land_8_20_14_3_00_34_13]PIX09404.1 MAG: nicotinate-nucleotide adenylyltransferase [Flavobacteriaceae bacterium CG_4_8_14_3_um_filter_34_